MIKLIAELIENKRLKNELRKKELKAERELIEQKILKKQQSTEKAKQNRKRKIEKFIFKKVDNFIDGRFKCAICGCCEYNTHGHINFYSLRTIEYTESNSLELCERKELYEPMIKIKCSKCEHALFLNSILIGVLNKNGDLLI